MSRPKSEINEKREKLKRELEEEKYSECTFKPSITAYKGLNKSFSEFPVQERLYQDAEMKFFERERIKREKEEESIANFPFRPQIQSSITKLVGEKKDKPPIYQRIQEIQREMIENRNNIIIEAETNDPDLTFKPKLNTNSLYLADLRKTRGNSSSFRNDSQLKKYQNSDQHLLDEKYTFTPQISTFGSNIPAKDFLERQQILQAKTRAKRDEMIDRMQRTSFSFTPEIDKTSKYIVQSNKNRYSKTIEERFKSDLEKSRLLKAGLEEKYYGKYKFEPKINEISKSIAKSTSLSDISNNSFSIAIKKKNAEDKAIEDERSHSFTPTRTKGSKFEYVSSVYRQSDDILNKIKQQTSLKKKKIDESKKNKENEEMKEGTFTPQSTGSRFYQENKINIKGTDRFFELRAIANRRDEENRERENKVFFKNPKGRNDSFVTVPKPFDLHPSNKKQKIDKIREELTIKEQQACIFHPQINKQ